MESFDLIVIGGGPGGYLCAERAAQAGLNAAVCESRTLGGTCLNEGCIPTKSLLYCAKRYTGVLNSADCGVSCENIAYDHASAVARKDTVVATLVRGVESTMKAHHVTVIPETAAVTGRDEAGQFFVSAGGRELSCKYLVIATGSEAVVPPIPGIKEGLASGFVMTNREILDCKEVPEELVCIGGGVIGLEMACYYAAIGKKVHIIEMMPKIAGPTDGDICRVLMKTYKRQGMTFCLNAKVEAIGTNSVTYSDAKGTHTIACEKVLLSAGRRARTGSVHPEAIGIITDRGAIVTDDHLRTNVPNVYAVGDCNGKLMLAHTAYREAEVAVNNILGQEDAIDYSAIPSVIYTAPEVACAGETAESAAEKGLNFKVLQAPMLMSGRYIAENLHGNGLCKLVIDQDRRCLIGVHIAGPYASEMIYGAAAMIQQKMPVEEMKKVVFPHPTISEVIREALFTF